MTNKLLLLPGDGIGPEVMAEAKAVIAFMNEAGLGSFETEEDLVGGSAYDAHGVADHRCRRWRRRLPPTPSSSARSAGRNGTRCPTSSAPRRRCCGLSKELGVFANLRPAICYPALADASSLKRELVEGLDILILRELTGGVYFGEPKEIRDLGNGQKRAIDTQVYDTFEIERIARVAFELARTRRNKVTSMEKRNVMKSGVLWHEVVTDVHAREYPDVTLDHMLADAGGMQLVRAPKQFDVIVTDNLFGDMLSDVAAMLTGSLGMLPSASLGAPDPVTKKRKALYEPVHGSAPDIAGKGIANPIAMIASFAMCLRYSFGMTREADMLEQAIADALAKGLRTADIWSEGTNKVGTKEMGAAILEEFARSPRPELEAASPRRLRFALLQKADRAPGKHRGEPDDERAEGRRADLVGDRLAFQRILPVARRAQRQRIHNAERDKRDLDQERDVHSVGHRPHAEEQEAGRDREEDRDRRHARQR